MLYWLLYMMGLGIFSDDDEVCYEDSEEEDVDHASPPKDNEQAGPSVPRTVTTADSVTKKRAPPIHSFFSMPNKKLAFRSEAPAAERSESEAVYLSTVLHEIHLSHSCSCVIRF